MTREKTIETLLTEKRKFRPHSEFRKKARIKTLKEYETLYKRSIEYPDTFWAARAAELDWFKPWSEVRSGGSPFVTLRKGIDANAGLRKQLMAHRPLRGIHEISAR